VQPNIVPISSSMYHPMHRAVPDVSAAAVHYPAAAYYPAAAPYPGSPRYSAGPAPLMAAYPLSSQPQPQPQWARVSR
jgi:hypothetical protein